MRAGHLDDEDATDLVPGLGALDVIQKVCRQTSEVGAVCGKCRTYGSGAARLAAIPAGASPANTRSPVHVVVIPSGREGDQTAESLEVKALWGRGDLVRSVKGGRATWQAVA